MVLVTVLMVVVILMIISIGILGRSSTQAVSTERQIDRIKAEQVLKGYFWRVYDELANGQLPTSPVVYPVDGKNYTATATLILPRGNGPNGTDIYQFDVTY